MCLSAIESERLKAHKQISHIAGNHRSVIDSEGEFIALPQIEDEDYSEQEMGVASDSNSESEDSKSEESDSASEESEADDSDSESEKSSSN